MEMSFFPPKHVVFEVSVECMVFFAQELIEYLSDYDY